MARAGSLRISYFATNGNWFALNCQYPALALNARELMRQWPSGIIARKINLEKVCLAPHRQTWVRVMLKVLGRFAVVMAHPDDEILWASSLLSPAEKLVLCFGPTEAPEMGPARREAIARLPVHDIAFLDIPEAGVFDHGRWPYPVATDYGLALKRSAGHWALVRRYQENFLTLAEKIGPLIEGFDTIVTHNPWGEYGHEEHVQVFRVVSTLAARLGKPVLVTSYVSEKASAYMRTWLPRLQPVTPPLPTDRARAEAFRTIYRETGCWTWQPGYQWPGHECFYRVLGDDERRSGGTALPVNFIDDAFFSIPPSSERARLWLHAKARGIARRIGMKRD